MPEGLEAEIYASAADQLVGHRITAVAADERCADSLQLASLVGSRISGTRRHGKRVALVVDDALLELYFAMTGRLIVNGVAPIDALAYGPAQERSEWDRLVLTTDSGSLRVNDPRRWARFTLDPDWSTMGVDFMAAENELNMALCARQHRNASVKAILLDQSVIAGLGNLLTDEVLFRAGIDPRRPFSTLADEDFGQLSQQISSTVSELGALGGSHMGALHPEIRVADAQCPHDGSPLKRVTLAGRTTFFCSQHQR